MKRCKVTSLVLILLCLSITSLISRETTRREKQPPHTLPVPGATHLLPARPDIVLTLPFFDDFESGAPGWTAEGQFNLLANPPGVSVLSPGINPELVTLPDEGSLPAAFSGTHSWWFGETATGTFIGAGWDTLPQDPLNGGGSVDSQTGSLISPAIDLNGVSQAQLLFNTWWEIEGVDVDAFDLMNVEISIDNGASFEPIGRGLLNPLNDVDGEHWKSYSSAGLGLSGIWLEQLFNLTPYVGNTVYIRFRFDTVDALFNGFRGWLIDNVSVTDNPLSAPAITGVLPTVAFPEELVVINGQNFSNDALVEIGGVPPLSAVIATSQAVIEAPFLPAGQYDVKLTNPDGQFALVPNGLIMTDTPPPTLFFVDPDSAQTGTSVAVTISGFDFQSGSTADIGGAPLNNVTLVNPFTIIGDSPSSLPAGNYNVRVSNPDGQTDQLALAFTVYNLTAIEPVEGIRLNGYELHQNFPNPFNPATRIRFAIPQSTRVKLSVFNVVGQEVATLVDRFLSAGSYEADFQANDLNSGVFFYQITAGEYQAIKKMIFLK